MQLGCKERGDLVLGVVYSLVLGAVADGDRVFEAPEKAERPSPPAMWIRGRLNRRFVYEVLPRTLDLA